MKKEEKKNNNLYIIVLAVIAVILLVLGLVLIKGCSKKDKEKENIVEKDPAKEEDIIAAYNMSGDDAINLVKSIHNSDVYEFSYKINKDSKYVVTVKNLVTEDISKYIVDPTSTNGSFYEINE